MFLLARFVHLSLVASAGYSASTRQACDEKRAAVLSGSTLLAVQEP